MATKKTSASKVVLTCDMRKGCPNPVTHIGSKGYTYCASHAIDRRTGGNEHTRKLRVWEIGLLQAGKPLPSYEPKPRPRPDVPTSQLHVNTPAVRVAPGLPANAAYYIAEARKLATDELEIDDTPEVSPGDGGAFVAAWVWIPSGGLKTEQFNFSMQTRVCDAFKASEIYETLDIHHIHAAFEHGQWWIIATMNEGNESDQITYSVVDAEGGDSVDEFDFEEVSK